jgi:hypothetical protein
MNEQEAREVHGKKEYEAPKIKDLFEVSASGEGPFPPLQVCTPTGSGTNTPCTSGVL